MERKLITTGDGSHSFFVPVLNEQYHSTAGSIQESVHVFIQSGLSMCMNQKLVVFEIGFGTGLNALLTLLNCEKSGKDITYLSVEKYPLIPSEYRLLNYPEQLNLEDNHLFLSLHECNWNQTVVISEHFTLHKIENDCRKVDIDKLPLFDLVYFDAFAPNKQPDLWNEDIYTKIANHCNDGAILVTYCCKGIVRRGLQQSGFKVFRIPGPPGKKEMIRAIK